MLETYGKPNLLRRMFRLYKPNEVRLTDVTYLKYGEGLKAYGSALIDPVTGMLIAFIVSENNDIELAKVWTDIPALTEESYTPIKAPCIYLRNFKKR